MALQRISQPLHHMITLTFTQWLGAWHTPVILLTGGQNLEQCEGGSPAYP